ncbi:RNA methyltransferase [Parasynechococcus sp.]|uniref:RNA methyltransferase n=1 Tax=Parasynechococcus sp. TaxID=3101203 RepID=UPI0037042589
MGSSDQLLLSDLLQHTVRCDLGLDHGPGVMAWMHPPVHRLLGWVSRPSALRMTREVWRLDQCCGFTDDQVFVRGEPAVTDPTTLDRLPTLLNAELLDRHGERLGAVADLVFDPTSGDIQHYLVSRSDPRLPGTSRWRLTPDRIVDQQPGVVSTGLDGLDDLPLSRSSVRQDLLQRTQRWRDQLRDIGDRAGDRLEGWLDEPPWDEPSEPSWQDSAEPPPQRRPPAPSSDQVDPLDDWDDQLWDEQQQRRSRSRDEDPWV